jgi:reactive intermediate/imine deaminase
VFYDASQHGNTIYVSGQIGLDPATGDFVGDDVESQTERVMLSISEILKAAGANMSDVVKCNIFVTNMGDFAAVNAIYAKSTCRFRRSISLARPAARASRTPFCSCHSRTHTHTLTRGFVCTNHAGFPENPPARATVEVPTLPKGAKIEIDAIAMV